MTTTAAIAAHTVARNYRQRPPQGEMIYLVPPDRFENGDAAKHRGRLSDDWLATGHDAPAKSFYHRGDLNGLTNRLGYIQRLGTTALWVGSIFKYKPVHVLPGEQSAGCHGYWITDFGASIRIRVRTPSPRCSSMGRTPAG